jgi:hypothetical protein
MKRSRHETRRNERSGKEGEPWTLISPESAFIRLLVRLGHVQIDNTCLKVSQNSCSVRLLKARQKPVSLESKFAADDDHFLFPLFFRSNSSNQTFCLDFRCSSVAFDGIRLIQLRLASLDRRQTNQTTKSEFGMMRLFRALSIAFHQSQSRTVRGAFQEEDRGRLGRGRRRRRRRRRR